MMARCHVVMTGTLEEKLSIVHVASNTLAFPTRTSQTVCCIPVHTSATMHTGKCGGQSAEDINPQYPINPQLVFEV